MPLALARQLGLAEPLLPQNWLTVDDVANLLHLADFEVLRHWDEILWPLACRSWQPRQPLPGARLAVLPPGLTNFLVAAADATLAGAHEPRVSVIVPARNEAGNIPAIFGRVPEMGVGTELVFVEGHSKDDTYAAIEREIAAQPAPSSQAPAPDRQGQGRRRARSGSPPRAATC